MYTLEKLQSKTFKEIKEIGYQLNALPAGDRRCRQSWIDAIAGVLPPLLELLKVSPADSERNERSSEQLNGAEVKPASGPIDIQRTEPIESKFGRIVYPRAGSKSIAQLPETLNGVEDIQGQNHAEPNGTGTGQIGTDEIAIGSGIHQQCLNPAEPDGSNDGTQTETPGSQESDRILAAAGNGQAVERRPLPRKPDELTATFNDDRPPNRGDSDRDRLESEPKVSRIAIEQAAKTSRSADRKTSTAHQLLELFKSSAHIIDPPKPEVEALESAIEPTTDDLSPILTGVTFSDGFLARYSPPQTHNIHFKADTDGQLSLLDFEIELVDEPPDPDDFHCMLAFWAAYDAWCERTGDDSEHLGFNSKHCEPIELSLSSTIEWPPCPEEWYEPQPQTIETNETVSCTLKSSSTCNFSIPTFDAWCDRPSDKDEPPTAGTGVRRPSPKPPTFGPAMVVAGDRANRIKKFARSAILSSGRAPPGGDALQTP